MTFHLKKLRTKGRDDGAPYKQDEAHNPGQYEQIGRNGLLDTGMSGRAGRDRCSHSTGKAQGK